MVTEVLTSPFPKTRDREGIRAPLAAEAWPLPGFVGSGVGNAGRSQGIGEGPQYYPLSPRQSRAHPQSAGAGCVSVADPAISRWLHSPGSLEASYAGLAGRSAMAKFSTPPATPPAHRVGSLREGLTRSSEPSRYGRLESDPRHVEADGIGKISGFISNTSLSRDRPAMAWGFRASVDEEKKELLRCLEASNQRNQELELERQGLKNSLERMEKLLVDLVGSQAAHGAHSVQSDAGRTYASWTPSVTPPRMIPAELNPQGSPPRVRGASPLRPMQPLRHFSLSILDNSQQDRYSFTREMEPRRSRRPWSPPRGYVSPSEALPTPPKLRAPMVHSGYGLVTEPITAAADAVEARFRGPGGPGGVPPSLATSQSWMCRDRYNLVDICQNLPPRLKRW